MDQPLSFDLCLFGGAFDPPHIGHLLLAEAVRQNLAIPRITLLPAAHTPLKKHAAASAADRLAMLKLTIKNSPWLEIDEREIRHGNIRYTIDTVEEILNEHPGWRIGFVIGGDQLAKLPQWKDVSRLATLVTFIAALRPPHTQGVFDELKKDFSPEIVQGIRAHQVQMPQLDIASSDLRERVRQGRSIRWLVPPEVEAYIEQHQLYRK